MAPGNDNRLLEAGDKMRSTAAGRRASGVQRQPQPRPSAGFTLFEILIAMMILSFVFTTLFVSYRQLVENAQAVARKNTLTEMTAAALHHFQADLKAAFILMPPFYRPPGTNATGPSAYRFTGGTTPVGSATFADVRFVSGRHIDLDGIAGEGLAAIRYYVSEDENREYNLKRHDRIVALDAMEALAPRPDPVVCEHVNRFEITYYDSDGNTQDVWDSESESFGYATPAAIRIVLGVAIPDGESMTLTTTVTLMARRLETGADE